MCIYDVMYREMSVWLKGCECEVGWNSDMVEGREREV